MFDFTDKRQPIELRDSKGRIRTYLPERVIGSGGIANVWLAQRRDDGDSSDEEQILSRVALKVATGLRKIEFLEREASILSQIRDQGNPQSRIVRIAADGEVLRTGDKQHAIIELEYLDGQTLKAWFDDWKRKKIGPLEAAEVATRHVLELAHALCELEALGKVVLHRDVKPENIMMTSTGLRLFDFNVARLDTEYGDKTEYVGTGRYMAPEVRFGDQYDRRADLYSVGVIYNELLLQRKFPQVPWQKKSAETSFVVPWDDTPFDVLPSSIRGALRDVLTSLIVDQDRRLPSAEALRVKLEELYKQLRTQSRKGRASEDVAEVLANIDLIQLVSELRPDGLNSVVADTSEIAPLQRLLRDRLRVDDPLEDLLVERIRAAAESDTLTLVVLAGNAGDGKSHLIDRLVRHRFANDSALLSKLRYIADATHAETPTESQQDRLEQFFAPFASTPEPTDAPVHLIAINTGMILRFFEEAARRHDAGACQCGDLSRVFEALGTRLGLRHGSPAALPFDLLLVNLDLRDLLHRQDDSTSFLDRMLDRLDPEMERGLLVEKWKECETCTARHVCSTHFNIASLREPRVRTALHGLLERADLDPEVHLSPRLLWSVIYRLITGGLSTYDTEPGEGPCDVVRRNANDSPWLVARQFTEIPFGRLPLPDVPFWHALSRIDPAFSGAPTLDRLHTQFSLQQHRDDSNEELEKLGGQDGHLFGLKLDRILAVGAQDDATAHRRRNAAVRRRVFFDASKFEAFARWGAVREFRHLLDAFEVYSRSGPNGLEPEHRKALGDLTKMVSEVFLRGAGRTLARRQFLRLSQPHPGSESHLLIEVNNHDLTKLFKATEILQPDLHVRAHVDAPTLLAALGYSPKTITLSLNGQRLVVDLQMYDFLREVGAGRQPSKRDLAQFETLLYLGEHIGNALAEKQRATGGALFIYNEAKHTLHRLHRDEFGTVTLSEESLN